MKRICFILMALLSAQMLSAQDIQKFVRQQLETYPESRLLDIYKSCFQDHMGAEHLVSDRNSVEEYLDQELNTTDINDLQSWLYEPCGIDGNYVRVSIRAIQEHLITKEQLLDAFIRSANEGKHPTVGSWKKRWKKIIRTIEKDMHLSLPFYEQDKQFIDSILSQGRYAISHSLEYRNAYHPHYRIVERTIFENEIKPILDNSKNKNKMKEISYKEMKFNPFNLLGDEWMLVSAGNEREGCNTMTISWGHFGCIWGSNDPTAVVYIRPSRYTKTFVDKEKYFTLCVMDRSFKKQMAYLGSTSGRDEDKITKAGLTKIFADNSVYFEEAKMVIICKKLYASELQEKGFLYQEIIDRQYPAKDFHTMYVGKIEKILVRDDEYCQVNIK